jgi:osmoprotectant transport system permease protein
MITVVAAPLVRWDWIFRNGDKILDRVAEHLVLTGIAVGVGLTISLALTAIILRWRVTYGPITGITGLMYSIPSVALFAFFVPITGITLLTAEIALVSYTLLILIRNIVAGLDGVSEDVREAATGMGYTRRRLLFEIELPLALPVIITGIRIATVTVIGLVTISSLIGLGGLGQFILQGLTTFSSPIGTTKIFLGTGLSIVLAVAIDFALVLIERLVTPWTRRATS